MRQSDQKRARYTSRFGLVLGVTLGAGLMLGVGGALGFSVAGRLSEPTVVGTLDIDRVSVELQEAKDRQAEIVAATQTRADELQSLGETLEGLNEELSVLAETERQERVRLTIEIEAARTNLQARQQLYSRELELRDAELKRELYEKIVDAARRVAERDGYDMVLLDDGIISLDGPRVVDGASLLEAMLSKKVIYASDTVDLSSSVLTLMNNEFAAGPSE
ncbi:MAG: OmpH family outer membrane protein [Planctomycetota bacterium]